MKKTKLFTCLSAFLLVLSLGACSTPDDDSSTTSEEEPNYSTSSDKTILSLENYTLSITLLENGEVINIPSYDAFYIIGDWDNWTSFIPLERDEDNYLYTFSKIDVGVHEFKGVVAYADEIVSWNNCVEIIKGERSANATFEVLETENNNYTKELTFEIQNEIPLIEETQFSDEEIIEMIIDECVSVYNNVSWNAFHGYYYEDDVVSDEVYYTTDSEGYLYGKWITYDNGVIDLTNYIQSGVKYYIDEDGYQAASYSQDYEDEFSNYACALEAFSKAEVPDCELIHEEGSSTYVLTINDSSLDVATCLREGNAFSITKVEDSLNGEYYSAESVSRSQVARQMSGFDYLDWLNPTNPSELIEKAYLAKNYSVEIVYDSYISVDSIPYPTYQLASEGDPDALEEYYALQDNMELDESYLYDIYYMDDYLLEITYALDDDEYCFATLELFVNEDGSCWDYIYENGNFYTDYFEDEKWQKYYWSLYDAYDYQIGGNFEEFYSDDQGTLYGLTGFVGYYGTPAGYWFTMLGTQFIFGDYALTFGSNDFDYWFSYFDKENEEFTSLYSFSYDLYDSYPYTDDTQMYYGEDDVALTISDVGRTDMTSVCEELHANFQKMINES